MELYTKRRQSINCWSRDGYVASEVSNHDQTWVYNRLEALRSHKVSHSHDRNEIFMPRILSHQSLTLGTSASLWFILTGYEPCTPGTLGLLFGPPSCSCTIFYSCYIDFHSVSLCSTPRTHSSVLPSHPQHFLSSWPMTLPVLRPLPSRNSPPPTTQPGRGKWMPSFVPRASGLLSVVLKSALMIPMLISMPSGTLELKTLP